MSAVDADVRRGREAGLQEAVAVPRPIRFERWLVFTILLDVLWALVAGLVAWRFRFGDASNDYVLLSVALPVAWIVVLAASGSYDRRFMTTGAEPFRIVINSGLALLAFAAIASFVAKAQLSREWVAVTVLVLTPLTLVGRYAGRKYVHHLMGRGRALHTVLVAGSSREVAGIVRHMRRAPYAGFSVRAVCRLDPGMHASNLMGVESFDVGVDDLPRLAQSLEADTIAIAGTSSLPDGGLRNLAWSLEGTDIQLMVAPAVSDFAGPRIVVRPVDGLPLLAIEEPDLHGIRRVAKEVIDRALAGLLLVAFSPVMLAIVLAIKRDDRGPILFRQTRVGRDGQHFSIWKFRTMSTDAQERLPGLVAGNEHDGLLFKIRQDPRVTRTGRFLRRHSLDEIPQLLNVVRGEMSLVGPRPPLPEELERFGHDVRRRLLVKPGMTGLWQINGRTDLPWDEAVRLDLHYVENWSVALDLMVLWKTFAVVWHGRGGY